MIITAFSRSRLCLAAVLGTSMGLGWGAGVAAQSKPPAAQQAPQPAQIDRNGVLILIRSTLLALNQANETGNYTTLRDLGAPGFRQANTAARLAEIFASLRAQDLDLSGVAVLEPQLTLSPQIDPNGLLHMAGFFPSTPLQINFELLFAPVDGRWRPFGISVGVGSASPSAPNAPAEIPADGQSAETKKEQTGAQTKSNTARPTATKSVKPTEQSSPSE